MSVANTPPERTHVTRIGEKVHPLAVLCPGCGQYGLMPVARDLLRPAVWVLACSCGAVWEWESLAT